MTFKQGFATAVLAMLIVGSVAFMPVSAGVKEPQARAVRTSGMIAQSPAVASELPQDQVRDLTYN